MVSLDDNRREAHDEEHFHFSEDANAMNEEEELLGHCLVNANAVAFHQVKTTCVAILSLIFLVFFEAFVILLPIICYEHHCYVGVVSGTTLLQILVWCLFLVIDQYYRRQHRKMRQIGYLKFYRDTRALKRSTLFIFSVGNAVLLLTMVFLYEYCLPDNLCSNAIRLYPVNFIQGIETLEVLISVPFVIIYIIRIRKFNKQRLPPDIHQENIDVSYSHLSIPEAEIGFCSDDSSNEVIEKQGDYIRYLKQHNANLGRKLLCLTRELKSLKTA